MRRLLWFLPIFAGLFLGFVLPVESAMLRTYTAYIYPASGNKGEMVRLNCGWHGGGCGTSIGDFLDWDNTGTNYVFFRGKFKRNNASYETNRLKGWRTNVSNAKCAIQDVAIIHESSSTILGYMRYIHTSTSSTGYFPIATSHDGVYNSKALGTMTNDVDCGGWNGTHVHAGYRIDRGAAERRKLELYPFGDYCTGANCRTYNNDSQSNWTHRFTWNGL
jgi:hypothetical protein